MYDKIAKVVQRYEEIEARMVDPEVLSDYQLLSELAQERSELQPLVESYRRYLDLRQELADTRELLDNSDDPDMADLAVDEIERLEGEIETLEEEMRRLLLPRDPRDEKNVYIEIRAGAGGVGNHLRRRSAANVYAFAERKSWRTGSSAPADRVGGYKEVVFNVKVAALSQFKYESGVHRVNACGDRVAGRIHKRTAVSVMPE